MDFDLSPLWISLKTAAIATVFAFVTGIAAAGWMFAYRGKGKGIIDGIFTLPLVLPPTVIGFVLLLLLGRNSPIGQLLMQLGISIIFSWPAAVIASTVVAFPLMYKTVLGAFKQVNPDLINCARTLGASEARIFGQVLLPLAWPGAIAGTILAFARALGEFGATLMVAGSIPGQTQTMPVAIFFAAEAGKMSEATIWVGITIFIALSAIASINYWSDSPNFSQTRLVKYCSLILNRCSAIISRQLNFSQPDRANSNSSLLTRAHPKSIPPSLLVELQKDLASFTLAANFTNSDKPLGILGASGSGKSMTLRCIAGLETPDRGRIVLNGKVLFDAKQKINLPSRQRRIGFVFQNYALFPHMRVAQNIAFGMPAMSIDERKQKVQQYIDLLGLQGLERRYPQELSGGQQQRVALARALAIAPEALLLDEPLSALDSYLHSQIEQLLIEVSATFQGVTLLVTHNLGEAYRICQNLLVVSQGKIVAAGSKQDIFERPPNFTAAQLTECKNFSRVQVIDSQRVRALDWDCDLQVIEPINSAIAYIGIRAHHLKISPHTTGENIFPCWLAAMSETQHRATLYLKLNSPSNNSQDYHLQAEVFKEKWHELKNMPLPWYLYLEPLRLILMAE